MPGESAVMGDILVELGKRYGEKFNTLVIDKNNRVINAVAMMGGKIIGYETIIPDGAKTQLTVIMDGGC
jgi:DNA repair protein RadC